MDPNNAFELLQDLVIGGFALVPFITMIVQFAKAQGLPSDKAPVLTGLLAVLGYAVVTYVEPMYPEVVAAIATMVAFYLSSTGAYKLTKSRSKKFSLKESWPQEKSSG